MIRRLLYIHEHTSALQDLYYGSSSEMNMCMCITFVLFKEGKTQFLK